MSKYYQLHRQARPQSLREWFVRPFQRRPTLPPLPTAAATVGDQFWALRNVSFNIGRGESVGLIGANGAGKSTTLKLLSRVIQPSLGQVQVQGRIAALLELGTGFHPELSGRDNVFLSAALIGVSRAEMQRKYPAVVEFSELGDFMELPVKHYSSGMFARLAFSVSIYLDPEILLVDEVLAVGDQSFQQKCLDRLEALKARGITICLVTHDLGNVQRLCTRALWFEHGQLLADGPADTVAQRYLNAVAEREGERLLALNAANQATQETVPAAPATLGVTAETPPPTLDAPPTRWGTQRVEITQLRLLNQAGESTALFTAGERFQLEIRYHAAEPIAGPIFGLALHRHDGVHVTGPNTGTAGLTLPTLVGSGQVVYTVPQLPLLEGLYHLSVAVINHDDTEMFDYHDRTLSFRVMVPTDNYRGERYGLLALGGQWECQPEPT